MAWRLGLPVLGSIHGPIRTAGQRWLYGRCSRLLVWSAGDREDLGRSGFQRHAIDVRTPGVDADVFSPSRRSERLRERWHASPRRLAVAWITDAFDGKALRFVEAFRDRMYARGVEHALVCVSTEVASAAVRQRLEDAVFTGALPDPALAETLASADLALFPTAASAAVPLVLMGQACGLPAVVVAGSPAFEQIVDGVTGCSCQADAADGWAEAAASLVRAPRRLESMRRQSRVRAARRTWPLALDPVFGVYRRMHRQGSTATSRAVPADEDRPRIESLAATRGEAARFNQDVILP